MPKSFGYGETEELNNLVGELVDSALCDSRRRIEDSINELKNLEETLESNVSTIQEKLGWVKKKRELLEKTAHGFDLLK